MTKYIFVTGGVVSSLGKGIVSASVGRILKNKDIKVWINGELLHRDQAKVSVFDSSVQGGDAVWEGIRVYDGRIFCLEKADRIQGVLITVIGSMAQLLTTIIFGLIGMLAFVGMALTGLAADKWSRHHVATVSYTLTFVGISALALIQLYPNWLTVTIFIGGFGLSAGARGPIITTLSLIHI